MLRNSGEYSAACQALASSTCRSSQSGTNSELIKRYKVLKRNGF